MFNKFSVLDISEYFGATKLTKLVLPPLNVVLSPPVQTLNSSISIIKLALDETRLAPPLGLPDAWYRQLLYNSFDQNGIGMSSAYFVPLSAGADAIKAILPLAAEISNLSLGVELRVIAADDAWLSTANGENSGGEPSLSIDFGWLPDVQQALVMTSKIERAMASLKPKPHWGKLFTMEPSAYLPTYRRLDAFRRVANELDPHGKFRNSFLTEKIFVEF